jgi:hypothetical protein
MYAGAFIPGLVLAGLYALYVLGTTIVKPHWAPALPPEARTMREPDGGSGTPSLVVLVVIAIVAAVAYAKLRMEGHPLDEVLVIATTVGTAVAFFAAVLNRQRKRGLLSRIAERGVVVLIPPHARIFLVEFAHEHARVDGECHVVLPVALAMAARAMLIVTFVSPTLSRMVCNASSNSGAAAIRRAFAFIGPPLDLDRLDVPRLVQGELGEVVAGAVVGECAVGDPHEVAHTKVDG